MAEDLFGVMTMECGISHLSVYLVSIDIQDFGHGVTIIMSKLI